MRRTGEVPVGGALASKGLNKTEKRNSTPQTTTDNPVFAPILSPGADSGDINKGPLPTIALRIVPAPHNAYNHFPRGIVPSLLLRP
jgi:hypothetical protein